MKYNLFFLENTNFHLIKYTWFKITRIPNDWIDYIINSIKKNQFDDYMSADFSYDNSISDNILTINFININHIL